MEPEKEGLGTSDQFFSSTGDNLSLSLVSDVQGRRSWEPSVYSRLVTGLWKGAGGSLVGHPSGVWELLGVVWEAPTMPPPVGVDPGNLETNIVSVFSCFPCANTSSFYSSPSFSFLPLSLTCRCSTKLCLWSNVTFLQNNFPSVGRPQADLEGSNKLLNGFPDTCWMVGNGKENGEIWHYWRSSSLNKGEKVVTFSWEQLGTTERELKRTDFQCFRLSPECFNRYWKECDTQRKTCSQRFWIDAGYKSRVSTA